MMGIVALSLACDDEDKNSQSIFDINEFDCEGWPNICKVKVANLDCEADGVFLLMEDSLVFSDDEPILMYKGQYGKSLEIGFCFGKRNRQETCIKDSTVLDINISFAEEL